MKLRKRLLIPAAVAAAVATVLAVRYAQGLADDPNAIRISGNIEVVDVAVSFKTAGWLEQRFLSEGEIVTAGTPLAELDARELAQEVEIRRAEVALSEARLAELEAGSRTEDLGQAAAALEQAKARLAELEAGARPQEVAAAEAAVRRVQAERDRLKKDWERQEQLFAENVVPRRDLDHATAAYHSSQAVLDDALQQLNLVKEGPRREQIMEAKAAVAQAQAAYDLVVAGPRSETLAQAGAELARARETLGLAETRLSYARIAAPLSGIVLTDHVERGEYVTPGRPIVTIGNLEEVWLRGYIQETDLGRVKLGQEVRVTTDTFPDKVYAGRITFISSAAEFTPKTVETAEERVKLVYRIKVDIPNPDLELKPGMPADAEIRIDGA